MSPSQLEDELDAAGLKVMEVGDISPPTMEAWLANSKVDRTTSRRVRGTLVVPLVPRIWMYLSVYLII